MSDNLLLQRKIILSIYHCQVNQINYALKNNLINNSSRFTFKDDLIITPLCISAEVGCNKLTKTLLDIGANPQEQCLNKSTPLHRAVLFKQLTSVNLLLEYGANGEYLDSFGLSPFHYASRLDDLNIFLSILSDIKDVNHKTSFGRAPIHISATSEKLIYLDLLSINHNIELDIETPEGNTAAHIAAEIDNKDILYSLHQHGANIFKPNPHGLTPLHFAVFHNSTHTTKYLYQHGADINAKSDQGLSPIYFAKEKNYKEIYTLFTKGFYPTFDDLIEYYGYNHNDTNKPLSITVNYDSNETISGEHTMENYYSENCF